MGVHPGRAKCGLFLLHSILCCSANTFGSRLPADPNPLGAEGNQMLGLHLALPSYPWPILTGELDDTSFDPVTIR